MVPKRRPVILQTSFIMIQGNNLWTPFVTRLPAAQHPKEDTLPEAQARFLGQMSLSVSNQSSPIALYEQLRYRRWLVALRRVLRRGPQVVSWAAGLVTHDTCREDKCELSEEHRSIRGN